MNKQIEIVYIIVKIQQNSLCVQYGKLWVNCLFQKLKQCHHLLSCDTTQLHVLQTVLGVSAWLCKLCTGFIFKLPCGFILFFL